MSLNFVGYLSEEGETTNSPSVGSFALPAAASGRLFVAVIHETDVLPTSVQIDGNSMTLVVELAGGTFAGRPCSIWKYQSDTLTGNVNVSWSLSSATGARAVGLYYIDDLASITEHDTDSQATVGLNNLSVNVPSNGVLIAGVTVGAGETITVDSWTGATEEYDDFFVTFGAYGASESGLSSETGRTVTPNYATDPSEDSAVVATWEVASGLDYSESVSAQIDFSENVQFQFQKILLDENISAQLDLTVDVAHNFALDVSVSSQIDFTSAAELVINLGFDVSSTIEFTESTEFVGPGFSFEVDARIEFSSNVSVALTWTFGASSVIEFSPSVVSSINFWNRELGLSEDWTEESGISDGWVEEEGASSSWTEDGSVSDSWSEDSPLSKSWTEETPL